MFEFCAWLKLSEPLEDRVAHTQSPSWSYYASRTRNVTWNAKACSNSAIHFCSSWQFYFECLARFRALFKNCWRSPRSCHLLGVCLLQAHLSLVFVNQRQSAEKTGVQEVRGARSTWTSNLPWMLWLNILNQPWSGKCLKKNEESDCFSQLLEWGCLNLWNVCIADEMRSLKPHRHPQGPRDVVG